MFVIRPIQEEDIERLQMCADQAELGIVHLPRDTFAIKQVVLRCKEALSKKVLSPKNEEYLFALEELETGLLVGTCGILAKINTRLPMHVFRIETPPFPKELPEPQERRILQLRTLQDSSELCALYLLPEYRHAGLGDLLSLSRLLFVTIFPERFENTFIANLRGVFKNRSSLFWEKIGRNFLNMDFLELSRLRAQNETLVLKILPTYPLPIALLPREVQELIGQCDLEAKPALQMLQREGFSVTKDIDPFDGGPILAGNKNELRTVVESQCGQIIEIKNKVDSSPTYLIANCRLDFRVSYGILKKTNEGLVVEKSLAETLKVSLGDSLCYLQKSKKPGNNR
jgi:arginine N-succinyltransferase